MPHIPFGISILINLGIYSLENAQAHSRFPPSASESTSRERRERTEDCKWTDIQARQLKSQVAGYYKLQNHSPKVQPTNALQLN